MKPAMKVLRVALGLVSAAAVIVATCERVNWMYRPIAYQKPSFDISRDGRRIVYANWDGDFAAVDTQTWTHRRLHILPTNRNANPAISPDGRFLAFASRIASEDNSHIYLYDFSARSLRCITSPDFNDTLPAFTPDGASLIFARSVPSNDITYPIK